MTDGARDPAGQKHSVAQGLRRLLRLLLSNRIADFGASLPKSFCREILKCSSDSISSARNTLDSELSNCWLRRWAGTAPVVVRKNRADAAPGTPSTLPPPAQSALARFGVP